MNNVKRDKAILRLRKLMGGKTWGSDEEMKTAMATIQRIMRQYNISMSDVEHAEIKCVQKSANGGKKQKRRNYMDKVVWRIARHCEVKYWKNNVFVGGKKQGFHYDFFGYPTDVDLALYLYDTIKLYIDQSVEEYKETDEYGWEVEAGYDSPRQLIHAFRLGCAIGIGNVLDNLHDDKIEEVKELQESVTETGLMVIKDKVIERDFKETGLKLVFSPGYQPSSSAFGGFNEGLAKGRKFKVTTGVGSEGASEHLLR